MSSKAQKPEKRTYFGISSLLTACLSIAFLILYFVVSQLDISPKTFFFWNVVSAFISCVTAPLAWILAFLAWRKSKDSNPMAVTAVALVGIPYLILFAQFALSFIP
jgi:hypothetical protein